MHMSDALLSPAVGGVMWLATGAAVTRSARKIGQTLDNRKIPFMGVLAAFVFAGQMINFTLPGTGSSGHLGGGMILAILLGPHAAFLAMASVLTVQALFFADGGLLALGCNIFNLGFFPAFVAYPLVFRLLAGRRPGPWRLTACSLAAAIFALQLGALAVVMQTVLSGVSDLPPASFAALMVTIHLAIGAVEGLVTAAVVAFVWKARPELTSTGGNSDLDGGISLGRLTGAVAVAALVTGGVLSLFASNLPDGLEWALGKVTGRTETAAPRGGPHEGLEKLQDKIAVLPDYGFPDDGEGESQGPISPGTSLSGILGGILSLCLAAAIGFLARDRFRGEPPSREGRRS